MMTPLRDRVLKDVETARADSAPVKMVTEYSTIQGDVQRSIASRSEPCVSALRIARQAWRIRYADSHAGEGVWSDSD